MCLEYLQNHLKKMAEDQLNNQYHGYGFVKHVRNVWIQPIV